MNPLKSIKVAIWNKCDKYCKRIKRLKYDLKALNPDFKAWRSDIELGIAWTRLKLALLSVFLPDWEQKHINEWYLND